MPAPRARRPGGNDRLRPVGRIGDSRSRHPSSQDERPPADQAAGSPSGVPDAGAAPVRSAPDFEGDRDPLGKMALFSADRPAHTYGTLLVECSACNRETPISVGQLMRSAFPFSLHLPLVKRYHSLMRCPACGRRAWMRVSWRA